MTNPQPVSSRTSPTVTDLDLDTAVAAIVNPVCERLGLSRSYLRGQHIHAVALDMVSWDAIGANEADLMSVGLFYIELAKTLKSQRTEDEKVAQRLQLDADLADDHLRGIIAINGESPAILDQYASALERTAAINCSEARRLRTRARQIRTNRTTAQQRIGLGLEVAP